MRFTQLIAPLFWAALSGAAALVLPSLLSSRDPTALIMVIFVLPLALAAEWVFVIPIMLLSFNARLPPPWVAALWGGTVGVLANGLWMMGSMASRSWDFRLPLMAAIPGAVAGVTYSLLAKQAPIRSRDTAERQQ